MTVAAAVLFRRATSTSSLHAYAYRLSRYVCSAQVSFNELVAYRTAGTRALKLGQVAVYAI